MVSNKISLRPHVLEKRRNYQTAVSTDPIVRSQRHSPRNGLGVKAIGGDRGTEIAGVKRAGNPPHGMIRNGDAMKVAKHIIKDARGGIPHGSQMGNGIGNLTPCDQ